MGTWNSNLASGVYSPRASSRTTSEAIHQKRISRFHGRSEAHRNSLPLACSDARRSDGRVNPRSSHSDAKASRRIRIVA